MEASSHIVVAWFLPCDFGGSHAYVVSSRKGYVHLTVGNKVGSFVEQESGRRIDLPFTLLLDSFRVEHYPGTEGSCGLCQPYSYLAVGGRIRTVPLAAALRFHEPHPVRNRVSASISRLLMKTNEVVG